VVLSALLEPRYGVGIEVPREDGNGSRLYFVVPRNEGSAIGTGYLPLVGDPGAASVSEEEAALFLQGLGGALGRAACTMDKVSHIECGVIPVRALRHGDPLFYEREILTEESGYFTLFGTKYTVFERQAVRVCDLAEREWCSRRRAP
jgi:glycerol-3-phosphate dehydrogenase